MATHVVRGPARPKDAAIVEELKNDECMAKPMW